MDVHAAYSGLDPDSPWRWAGLIGMPFAFVAVDLVVWAARNEDHTGGGWALGVVLVLLVATLLRRFSAAGYDAAVERERTTGGRRIVTRPGLALGMLAVGALALGAWVVAFVAPDPLRSTPIGWLPRSLAVPAIAVCWIRFGLQRPWDLEVVERGTSA